MWRRRRCGCRRCGFPWGYILIAAGIGFMLAYIIPYSFLITLLGIALIIIGICTCRRR